MKPLNNHNHQEPEEIADKLQVFSYIQTDKRNLLRSALRSVSMHQETVNNKTGMQVFASKLRLYIPATAIFVLAVVSASFLLAKKPAPTNNPISSNLSSEQTAVNGSVENAVNSIGADVEAENSLSQQIVSDGQAASQEVQSAVEQLGEISNENSF